MAYNSSILTEFFNKLDTGAVWSAGVAFERSAALPLEKYEVHKSVAAAENYAKTNPVAYPGQVIAVVEQTFKTENDVQVVDKENIKIYFIDENKDLQEVGSATLGDGETIELDPTSKILSLKGFAEANTGTKLIKNANGELEWAADSQATLDADLTKLTSRVDVNEENITGLKNKVDNLGSIFNFVGTFTQTDIMSGNHTADKYNVGDVCLVGNQEYVCVEVTTDGVTKNTWEPFGDPEGVASLQGRMDTAEGNITTLTSDLGALETSFGTLPTGYNNLVAYIDAKDAETLSDAKDYTDDAIEGLTNGAIKDNADSIEDILDDIEGLTSEVGTLKTSKLDSSTFDAYKTSNDAAVANKLNSADAASTYLTKEDASKTYYTSASAETLASRIGVVEGVVTDANSGNAALKSALATVTATANQNKTDIADNLQQIGVQGSAISTLQGQVTALQGADTTLTSDLTAVKSRVSTAEADIKNIYTPASGEGESATQASGLLVNEINRATLKEAELAKAIDDEAKAARAAEQSLGNAITDIQSKDLSQDGLLEGLRTDVDNIVNTTIPTLETKADATNKLTEAKKYTDDAITSVESTIGALSSQIGNLSNVMHFIGTLEVNKNNITSIEDVASTENIKIKSTVAFDTGDVGIYGQQEYVCIALTEETVEEVTTYISTWTAIGDVGATAAEFAAISAALDNKVETSAYNTKMGEIDDAIADLVSTIDGEIERATGIEEDLDARLTAAEEAIAKNIIDIGNNTTNITANTQAIGALETKIASDLEALLSWGEFK